MFSCILEFGVFIVPLRVFNSSSQTFKYSEVHVPINKSNRKNDTWLSLDRPNARTSGNRINRIRSPDILIYSDRVSIFLPYRVLGYSFFVHNPALYLVFIAGRVPDANLVYEYPHFSSPNIRISQIGSSMPGFCNTSRYDFLYLELYYKMT